MPLVLIWMLSTLGYDPRALPAQTALRDIIGRTTLTDLLRGRERIEDEGEQRNPVIVSSQDGCCLVLDGAHRVRALQELGRSRGLFG